jgi:hypothetical protein
MYLLRLDSGRGIEDSATATRPPKAQISEPAGWTDDDYAAVQTLGYDVNKKAYSGLWIDNTMSYQWQLHGSLEADSKELVISASGPGPSGGTCKFRERYSPDSITVTSDY